MKLGYLLSAWDGAQLKLPVARVQLAERLALGAGRWGMTLGALGAAYAAAGRIDEARQVIAELGLEHNRQAQSEEIPPVIS